MFADDKSVKSEVRFHAIFIVVYIAPNTRQAPHVNISVIVWSSIAT